MKAKGIRADNVSKSEEPPNKVMSYGADKGMAEIKAMQAEAKCYTQVEAITSEYNELKSKFEKKATLCTKSSTKPYQLAMRDAAEKSLKFS